MNPASLRSIVRPAGCALIFLLIAGTSPAAGDRADFSRQRDEMVRVQIEERGITTPAVLATLRKVPRHRFVPESQRPHAYEDRPLPIGEGQTISQPYIVALMTDVLRINRGEKVLEIGTGSGYQAAVLAEMGAEVFTVEIIQSLGRRAEKLLKSMGYNGVRVRIGDGYKGWSAHAPFDAVIVTCSPSHVPTPLKEQLAEGGRMVIPVGGSLFQELLVFTKKDGLLVKETAVPVRFVPMVGEDGKRY